MGTMETTLFRLTKQEERIVNYCAGKAKVYWEELAQFAKEPTSVKLKTLRKTVTDLKKKYRDANLPSPLTCEFVFLTTPDSKLAQPVTVESAPEPKLVQLRITRGGNRVSQDNKQPDLHIDFQLVPYYKRVKTRTNTINLSDNEWELFTLFHSNPAVMFSMEEIKNIVYKHFGDKTPHNWAEAIKRTLGKLRTNIRELKTDNRLVTVMGGNTTYYMMK